MFNSEIRPIITPTEASKKKVQPVPEVVNIDLPIEDQSGDISSTGNQPHPEGKAPLSWPPKGPDRTEDWQVPRKLDM